jgi:hypothetical protein
MNLNPPPNVRAVIYILVVIGTSVVVPLNAAHVLSDTLLLVWTSVSGAVSLLAGFNVSQK